MLKMWQRLWKKLLPLLAASIVLSFFMHLRWGITLADSFFIGAMVLILYALMGVVRNLGFFAGMLHGFRSVFRIMKNKPKPEAEDGDIINEGRKLLDMLSLMVIGLELFILSVLFSAS